MSVSHLAFYGDTVPLYRDTVCPIAPEARWGVPPPSPAGMARTQYDCTETLCVLCLRSPRRGERYIGTVSPSVLG